MRVAGICITGMVRRSRVVVSSSESCRTSLASLEFNMIHHLARAFAVRQQLNLASTVKVDAAPPVRPSAPAPVRPRPITPWGTPVRPSAGVSTHQLSQHGARGTPRLRIAADPHDARRTVIAGRFAEVCAALDRMVMEQEAIA